MKILLAKRNFLRAGRSLARALGGPTDCLCVPSVTMSHSDRTWTYYCPCVAPVASLMAPGRPGTLLTCDRRHPLLAGGSRWHWAVSGFPVPWSAASPRAGPARLCARGQSLGRLGAIARSRGNLGEGRPRANPCGRAGRGAAAAILWRAPPWNRPQNKCARAGCEQTSPT